VKARFNKSEVWWRVNIWGSVVDKLLDGIGPTQCDRKVASSSKSAPTLRGRKFSDVAIRLPKEPWNLFIGEEKAAEGAWTTAIQVQELPPLLSPPTINPPPPPTTLLVVTRSTRAVHCVPSLVG
jgi:hypothetical protein